MIFDYAVKEIASKTLTCNCESRRLCSSIL